MAASSSCAVVVSSAEAAAAVASARALRFSMAVCAASVAWAWTNGAATAAPFCRPVRSWVTVLAVWVRPPGMSTIPVMLFALTFSGPTSIATGDDGGVEISGMFRLRLSSAPATGTKSAITAVTTAVATKPRLSARGRRELPEPSVM